MDVSGQILDAILIDSEKIGHSAVIDADWQCDEADRYCHRCGATMAPQAVTESGCAFCRNRPIPWDQIIRLGTYREPLRSWILRMKFGGRWGWAEWFGEALAQQINTHLMPEPLVVMPIPLHWTRSLYRGFDQSRLIARQLAARADLPLAPVLRRRRRTMPQSRIQAKQHRWENVRGAFAMKSLDLTGWNILLVDDVTTTGSTARACVPLLRQAGASSICMAVVAVVDPQGGDFEFK